MTAKILVVDDDSCMRELLQLHLRSAGYHVRVAEDAVVAGRMLFQSVPDLLIVGVELRYMSFPDMNAALANRGLDVTWQVEPLATLAEDLGIARRLFGGDEIYPNQQLATLYYSPDFAARTDAAQRFMIAYIRSLRDYNDAFVRNVGRAEVAQILAQNTTVKDLALYDRIVPAGLDPDGRLNVQGIREDLALFVRLGCISGDPPDVSRLVDESYANYAVSVLGPYAR